MRLLSLATCLSAGALAFAAHAQVSGPAPASDPSLSQPPPATDQAPPPAPADQTAPPSAYGANATPPGATIQMQPQQPVVQAAPQPSGDYPRCKKGMRDSCTNPGGR